MLTNKEKNYLRKLANPLSAIFQVGKEGLNTNQVKGINDYLEAHEIVKVSLLKSLYIIFISFNSIINLLFNVDFHYRK